METSTISIPQEGEEAQEEICLDESFFIDDSYALMSFTYGSNTIDVYCLQSSSTDFDLTGQIIWPGAELLNQFLSKNSSILRGLSVLELGSGVGLTGILCASYCQKIVMTDHNDKVLEILQRNIDLQQISVRDSSLGFMTCEKLEWGNKDQIAHILAKHPEGFDIILGADICYQQDSLSFLFETVRFLLIHQKSDARKFILSYISRAKSIDEALFREVKNHDLMLHEIEGTRTKVHGVFEGFIFEAKPLEAW